MKPYHIAPLIAFIVAGWHFIALRHPPNTSWKRGGFGMYTTPSLGKRLIWIVQHQEDGEVTYTRIKNIATNQQKKLRYEIFDFKSFPNPKTEQKLLDKMVTIDAIPQDERDRTALILAESRLDQHQAQLHQNVLFPREIQ